MDAIVYTSNTGSTKRYAELLSQMIGLPAFALGDAKDKLSANAGIIYLGWIMASGVKGYRPPQSAIKYTPCAASAWGRPALSSKRSARKTTFPRLRRCSRFREISI